MHSFTVYEPSSGEIVGRYRLSYPGDIELNTPEGMAWVEGIGDQGLHYISHGLILDRPLLSAPTGGVAPHALDLSYLPAGTVVTLSNEDGDSMEVTDLAAGVQLSDPGVYHVRTAAPFPFRDLDVSITVTGA